MARSERAIWSGILAIVLMCAWVIRDANSEAPENPLTLPLIDGVEDRIDGIGYPDLKEEATADEPAIWSYRYVQPGGRQIQLELTVEPFPDNAQFFLEMTDAAGMVVDRLTPDDLRGRSTYLSNAAFGPMIQISLYGPKADGLVFKVTSAFHFISGHEVESIIGDDNREHLAIYEAPEAKIKIVRRVQGAVAKVSFLKFHNGVRARYVCTGFLVTRELLVTNQHCVSDDSVCRSTKVLFGYMLNNQGLIPEVEQYDCAGIVVVNADSDVTLLRLSESANEKWGVLKLATQDVKKGDRLFVIQHPAGEPKQISDINCTVLDIPVAGVKPGLDLAHSCDTMGGSSGSPVFNQLGEVVGLHHWGREPGSQFSNANRAVRSLAFGPIIGAYH